MVEEVVRVVRGGGDLVLRVIGVEDGVGEVGRGALEGCWHGRRRRGRLELERGEADCV